ADLPKNIESYYQETGRSGRDGEVAHCLLLFGRGDIPKIRYFIDQIENETEKAAAIVKLNSVTRFASQSVCRRKQLLAYFGETYEQDNCAHCDICLSDLKKVDITTEARMVMSAIMRTGERFGAGQIIDIVRGADTKRIRRYMHHNLKTYGVGKNKDKDYWRFIIDELIAQDKLIPEGERYPSMKISEKGREVLFGREKLYAIIRETPVLTHEEKEEIEGNPKLMERLKILRKKISIDHKVAPYIVFSDRSLNEMACYYPTTPESFLRIAGVGEKKLSSYGADFMKEIIVYLEEYPLTRIPDKPVKKELKEKSKTIKTMDVSFDLFSQGLAPDEIARKRGLALATIAVHLEQCILKGYEIDINRLVTPEKLKIVGDFLMNYGVRKLTPIVDFFSGEVSFEEARFVRAWIERKE
ncbi:MAG: helix-turn-helix domain-containing protein, partial [Spirochaetales bacterium]|nr:helix-turn-helix domain-containing protein [Spirochaetales bacterium]